MATETQKAQYIGQVQAAMTQLAQLAERADTLVRLHVDRGYDAAASDPVTLTDLQDYGVVVYDLGVAVNLLQAVAALGGGQAVSANAAFQATLSKWRVV